MNELTSLLPSPEFERLYPLLSDRLMRTAGALSGENFGSYLDATMREMLSRTFQGVGADEGAVWLLNADKGELIICHAWGLRAEQVMGFRLPVTSGIVSMVLATEQPFCENKVYTNRLQARALDEKLGVLTCSMLAAPLMFAKGLRGVVSCIRVKPSAEDPDPPDFPPGALNDIQFSAHLLGKLIEFEIVSVITGWDNGL